MEALFTSVSSRNAAVFAMTFPCVSMAPLGFPGRTHIVRVTHRQSSSRHLDALSHGLWVLVTCGSGGEAHQSQIVWFGRLGNIAKQQLERQTGNTNAELKLMTINRYVADQ